MFDVYSQRVKAARRSNIITGLPDAYGRGRIIGDYRRVALYGVDALIVGKKRERIELDLWYVEHRRWRVDVAIVWRRAKMLVNGDGLYKGATGGWKP